MDQVYWRRVLQASSLVNISQIDIGLRTGISGLRAEFQNPEFDAMISQVEKSEGLIRPGEGEIPELIEDSVLSSLQKLGYQWVWISDEFCSERKIHWIEDLKATYFMPAHGSIFTPDHSVLITTHWDSHFSLLCSDRGRSKV